MLVLALNTASERPSVALLEWKKVLAKTSWRGASNESVKLLPAISSLLKKARKTFKDLDRLIVVSGPGPFSSLRIGVTVANTLSLLLKIPLYAVATKATLGKKFEQIPKSVFKKMKIVTPEYLHPPHITMPHHA